MAARAIGPRRRRRMTWPCRTPAMATAWAAARCWAGPGGWMSCAATAGKAALRHRTAGRVVPRRLPEPWKPPGLGPARPRGARRRS
eukprot:4804798-Lingulodinium_polyedra.AAC.1